MRTRFERLLQRANLGWLSLLVVVLYLASILLDIFKAGQPEADRWIYEQGTRICSEMAAAVIVSLVAVILIEAVSRRELKASIDENLEAGIRAIKAAGDNIQHAMLQPVETLQTLERHIRGEMQNAGMCYRMFGHAGDPEVISNVNSRILQKSILRMSQDIVCSFRLHNSGDDDFLEMICTCLEKYKNLSDRPQRHGFRLVFDKSLAVNGARSALHYLTVTALNEEGNDMARTKLDLAGDLVSEPWAGNSTLYTLRDKLAADGSGNPAFVIPGGRSVTHAYEYTTRQKLSGREDLFMRDVTGRMKVRVPNDVARRFQVRLQAQTDLPGSGPEHFPEFLELEIPHVLLPMQGVVVQWHYQPDRRQASGSVAAGV